MADEISITDIMETNIIISRIIKERRKSLNFSQAYLSIQTGISKRVIENAESKNYYLSGKSISLDSFLRISNALGLNFTLGSTSTDIRAELEEDWRYSC